MRIALEIEGNVQILALKIELTVSTHQRFSEAIVLEKNQRAQ